MVELLIRLKGVPAELLDQLVQAGYFSNKSEAIRAGIIQLGKEFKLLNQPLAETTLMALKSNGLHNASNEVVVEVLDHWM